MNNSVPHFLLEEKDVWPSFLASGKPPTEFANMFPEDWPIGAKHRMTHELQFAHIWSKTGCCIYNLSHSLVALFALTSAPTINWDKMPHDAFLVKVPRKFLPVQSLLNSEDVWISISPRAVMPIADGETVPETAIVINNHTTKEGDVWAKMTTDISKVAYRLAANAVAYITEHRPCVVPSSSRARGKAAEGLTVWDVGLPKNIVVDKVFRDAAVHASSGKLGGIKRALEHCVRGHWRNQAVGSGLSDRRLTWIRPHKRGDESLGSVVMRIERML